MSNDAVSHDFVDVLSMVQEQMRDLSVMQQKRATLIATADAADGTVQVTVDAQRTVTDIVIDESFLEGFDFADLAGYIVTAAQEAAEEIDNQAASLLAPLTKRREQMSSLSGLVPGVPEFAELMKSLDSSALGMSDVGTAGACDDDTLEQSHFPTIRR